MQLNRRTAIKGALGGALVAGPQLGAGIRPSSGEPLWFEGVTVNTAQVDATVSGTVERPAVTAAGGGSDGDSEAADEARNVHARSRPSYRGLAYA